MHCRISPAIDSGQCCCRKEVRLVALAARRQAQVVHLIGKRYWDNFFNAAMPGCHRIWLEECRVALVQWVGNLRRYLECRRCQKTRYTERRLGSCGMSRR